MTKEQLDQGTYLQHDIEVLETIKKEQDAKHWVGFITSDHDVLKLHSDSLIADFKEFVNNEIEKLQAEFNGL